MDRKQLPNAFEFVALASARARQLLSGCVPRVASTEKPVRIAQREIREGAVQKIEEADQPATAE